VARPERVGPRKHRSALGWFVHRYGWRAYALPLLVAVTVVVLMQTLRAGPSAGMVVAAGKQGDVQTSSAVSTTVTVATPGPTTTVVTTTHAADRSAVSVAAASTAQTRPTGPNPTGRFAATVKDGMLPPGGNFAQKGRGTWHLVPGAGKPVGSGKEKFTYTVEIEDGIQDAASDQAFAHTVDAVLSDNRSWIAGGQFTLQRVDSGKPTFRVSLTSMMTLRGADLCQYTTPMEASCYRQDAGRVLINSGRWARGAVPFNGDLGAYRVYAINHEVGHALGFRHQPCGEHGMLAPVMMQQSFSTSDDVLHELDPEGIIGGVEIPADHKVCKFNAFPFPLGPPGLTTGGG